MHSVDPTTEQMIRSVLAYAENRLRLNPVPLDEGSRDPAELDAAIRGLLGDEPHNPDQVLGAYTSVMAPAVISADSPRYLGFIPAASSQEIPWIEAHEMSMSNSSAALVGAAGMKPRYRGLSAEITAGAMTEV